MPESELWIGMVLLKPLTPKAMKGAAGAYTDIITWASTADQFREKAATLAAEMDLYVVEVEDEEPLSVRRSEFELTEEVEDMASRAEHNPNAIIYGTFHQYPHGDA